MITFKQIGEAQWQRLDYRPGAEIRCKSEELFPNYKVNFDVYEEEGMGRVKIAYFLTSSDKQFFVQKYLEWRIDRPLTVIGILNNPETSIDDLNEVLELLGINYPDLSYVFKW